MKTPRAEISAVRSRDELLEAWEECGVVTPYPKRWAKELTRSRAADVLVARIGEQAVGTVTVWWPGPFQEDLAQELTSGELAEDKPTPTIYELLVRSEHQRRGIGRGLMMAAERQIKQRPDTLQRAVLAVAVYNSPAISLYRSLGYRHIPVGGEETIVFKTPMLHRGELVPAYVKSYAMLKDLS